MMFAQKNRWHFETAVNAGSAAPYLRPVCGRTQIEQLRSSPSLDSSPPDS
jgi:hypothetical protein